MSWWAFLAESQLCPFWNTSHLQHYDWDLRFAADTLIEVICEDEERDLWQIYLDRKDFANAFRRCRTQASTCLVKGMSNCLHSWFRPFKIPCHFFESLLLIPGSAAFLNAIFEMFLMMLCRIQYLRCFLQTIEFSSLYNKNFSNFKLAASQKCLARLFKRLCNWINLGTKLHADFHKAGLRSLDIR